MGPFTNSSILPNVSLHARRRLCKTEFILHAHDHMRQHIKHSINHIFELFLEFQGYIGAAMSAMVPVLLFREPRTHNVRCNCRLYAMQSEESARTN